MSAFLVLYRISVVRSALLLVSVVTDVPRAAREDVDRLDDDPPLVEIEVPPPVLLVVPPLLVVPTVVRLLLTAIVPFALSAMAIQLLSIQ